VNQAGPSLIRAQADATGASVPTATRKKTASPELSHGGRCDRAVPDALRADGRRQRVFGVRGRADLFEQAAADGTPIREIVGEDPVEFVDALVRNYSKGGYVDQERARLVNAIARAARSRPSK